MNNEYVIYHICRSSDKGDFSKGYIGITNNFERRMKEHKRYGNKHLKNALKKYDDIIEYVVSEGTENYCRWLEILWRPKEKLGWKYRRRWWFATKRYE